MLSTDNWAPPNMRNLATAFVNNLETVGNVELPIHMRWEHVLEYIPETRTTPIYAPFDAAFQRIYTTGTYEEVVAGIELAHLRWHFFRMLLVNDYGHTHINQYETEAATTWYNRLQDCLRTTVWKVRKSRRKKGAVPRRKKGHSWLH